jgi:hypothetical protein
MSMTLIYCIILPLALFGINKRVLGIRLALKRKDTSRLKGELFFLFLILLVFSGLILLIYNRSQED